MVIAFKDIVGCIIAMYPISFISMDSDDAGFPADIVIKAHPTVLKDIAEKFCILGYNDEHEGEALYGRLKPFVLLPFFKEANEPEYIDW